jgi:hypothetical protein
LSPARSPATDTAESLLGRGLNPPTRRRCCAAGQGRAVAASALRAHSPPSTAPIRTSALPIRRLAAAPSRLLPVGEGGDVGLWWCTWPPGVLRSLWRLHRNEPGWFVGEHMQLRRPRTPPEEEGDDETLRDGPADRAFPPASLTLAGEAER